MSGLLLSLSGLSQRVAESQTRERAQRAGHPLKPRGRSLLTYDTETDPFHHCTDPYCKKCVNPGPKSEGRVPQPFLHGVYNGDTDDYLEFETIEAFVKYIEKEKALVYAHNGGKFDFHPLRPYFNTDEPIMLINGRIAKVRIGQAEFRDSLNIFPNTRLADFGVKSDIAYEKMEADVRVIPEVRKEISLYMRQDCVGLWEQVARYRRDYGKGLTQAGTSMKYWEKHHYQDKAPRQTRQQFLQCKPYYYGGRVQCFEQGTRQEDFEVADINSAYPRAMLETHAISPNPIFDNRLPRLDSAIPQCFVKLRATARGCFPWRGADGELYFPEDEGYRTRTYTITGWELLAAFEMDAVTNVSIEEVMSFDKVISFKDYIQEHYQARLKATEEGDKAGRIFGKYFMNSLSGKFGADPANYSEYVIATDDTLEAWKARGYEHYQDWGRGRYLLHREPTEAQLTDITSRWRYYNVATAASITGYVRAFLYKSLVKASGLLYCDTDSIAARDLGQIDYGKELGKWKHEGHFDRYSIAGKKMYAFHVAGQPLDYDPKAKEPTWKIASKGVGFHSLTDGPQKMAELAAGSKVNFTPQVPTYSVSRQEPKFITRSITATAKDIRKVPIDVLGKLEQMEVNRPFADKLGLKRLDSHLYLA